MESPLKSNILYEMKELKEFINESNHQIKDVYLYIEAYVEQELSKQNNLTFLYVNISHLVDKLKNVGKTNERDIYNILCDFVKETKNKESVISVIDEKIEEAILPNINKISTREYYEDNKNKLMKLKEGVNTYELDEEVLLMYAAFIGDIDTIKELVKRNVDINKKNEKGYTALMIALDRGNNDLAKYLIESGANIKNKDGENVFKYVMSNGNMEVLRCYIKQGVYNKNELHNDNFIDINDSENLKLINDHIKLKFYKKEDIIEILLEGGMNIRKLEWFKDNILENLEIGMKKGENIRKVKEIVNEILDNKDIVLDIIKKDIRKIDVITGRGGKVRVILRKNNNNIKSKADKRYIKDNGKYEEKGKNDRSTILRVIRIPKKFFKKVYRMLTMKSIKYSNMFVKEKVQEEDYNNKKSLKLNMK